MKTRKGAPQSLYPRMPHCRDDKLVEARGEVITQRGSVKTQARGLPLFKYRISSAISFCQIRKPGVCCKLPTTVLLVLTAISLHFLSKIEKRWDENVLVFGRYAE